MIVKGDVSMVRKLVLSAVFYLLLGSLWGCSTLLPQKSEPLDQPRILEEDVSDSRPGTSAPSEQPPSAPSMGGPFPAQGLGQPAPPVVGTPPVSVDPADRPRRRYIWKDQKGGGRGWESAPEKLEAGQP